MQNLLDLVGPGRMCPPSIEPEVQPMLAAGTQLGKYRIVRLLGRGGMADVYEAEDAMLGRRVALKVLPPEFGRDDKAVTRFQKEVRAAAVLNHAGIVTVYDVAQEQGLHYYAMRLLAGGDLRERIEHGLTPEQALGVLHQLAGAFAHAHAAGFVHRDVKPENILFDEQGRAVLTDFGIAKAISSSAKMTATGVSIGTPRYISPEQARGKPVDARADLYSLGVILFEMLAGRTPFDAEDSLALIFKHVTEPVPRLPPELERYQPLVDTLMAKEPDERPASAEDVQAMVQPFLPAERSLRLPALKTAPAAPANERVVTAERRYAEQLAEEEQRQKREAQRRGSDAMPQPAPAAAPSPPAPSEPAPARAAPPPRDRGAAPPPTSGPSARVATAPSAMRWLPLLAAAVGLLLVVAAVWQLLPGDASDDGPVPAMTGDVIAAVAPESGGTDSPAEPPPAVMPAAAPAPTDAPVDVVDEDDAAAALEADAEAQAREQAEREAAQRKAAAEQQRKRQLEEERRKRAAAAPTAAPTADPAMSKAERMQWERARCDRHVSELFPGWTFTYAEIADYPGVKKQQSGYVETPPLAADYGAMQRYIIDPNGCIVGTLPAQ
ncbi:MAG: serine/threonine-protein kinase [Sinimarinibacterium flocculans]|uniref:serine/threonine-protein kinase n=1 Tax=Sinimarinibacterium flocculans TaxID=985250 RepID=UPI003C4FA70F